MHDVGVPKMEFVLIPEMPMSGDLPRLCFEKKNGGSPVLGTCESQEAQHYEFFEKAKISMTPKNKC